MHKVTEKEFREAALELAAILQTDGGNCLADSENEIQYLRSCADYTLKCMARVTRLICQSKKIDG